VLGNKLLTYMSIEDEIQALCPQGRLHRLPSLLCGPDTARTMYVSTEILDAVTPPFADSLQGERDAEFRQTLDAFLEGGMFSVAEDPYAKPSDAMLARVAPTAAEFWDIRSVVPRPGIRCLGAFIAQDIFVALTCANREDLDASGAWEAEIGRCTSEWRELFGSQLPLKGASLDEYLTNYFPV
jgi:hypothetical protein